jgi:hypothetical protein
MRLLAKFSPEFTWDGVAVRPKFLVERLPQFVHQLLRRLRAHFLSPNHNQTEEITRPEWEGLTNVTLSALSASCQLSALRSQLGKV